jgi:hypothetical protein
MLLLELPQVSQHAVCVVWIFESYRHKLCHLPSLSLVRKSGFVSASSATWAATDTGNL